MSVNELPTPNPILGIRVEETLRDKIAELAKAEGRTVSGFVRFYLERLVELEEAKQAGGDR